MLKIYGRANSLNVKKVLWMCGEIGLPFERFDFGRDHRPTTDPEFMKLSIYGVVPVVVDDDFVLRESNTIVRYLANTHARTDLYPTEHKARALAEQWMDYGSGDMSNGMRAVFQGGFLGLAPYNDPATIAAGAVDWNKQLARLEKQLAGGTPYIAGASFTIGDIPVGVMLHRWQTLEFEKPSLPAVDAYYRRLSERPAYRQHVHGSP